MDGAPSAVCGTRFWLFALIQPLLTPSLPYAATCKIPQTNGVPAFEVPGIEGSAGRGGEDVVCCPRHCGVCGGADCNKEGRNPDECCVSNVVKKQPACYVSGEAPCSMIIGMWNSLCHVE